MISGEFLDPDTLVLSLFYEPLPDVRPTWIYIGKSKPIAPLEFHRFYRNRLRTGASNLEFRISIWDREYNYEIWALGKFVHREGQPAVTIRNQKNVAPECLIWKRNGVTHRTDGPAIVLRGEDHWHFNGEYFPGLQKFISFENKGLALLRYIEARPEYRKKIIIVGRTTGWLDSTILDALEAAEALT